MILNIGCGAQVAKGWLNADINPSVAGADQADLRALPYGDATFEAAAAHHVLQMLPYTQVLGALAELARVIEPGGWARISVPNAVAGARAHARGDAAWFPRIAGDETSLDGLYCGWLTDYGNSRSVFTPQWLAELCTRAGFDHAMPTTVGRSFADIDGLVDLDSRAGESCFVEAQTS